MAHKNNGHKLIAAGTAMLIAEPALALAHTGGIGIIVGLAAGAIAYTAVDELEQATGRDFSLPARARSDQAHGSLLYRMVHGRSTRGDWQDEDDAEYNPYEDWDQEQPHDLPAWIELADVLVLAPDDLIAKAIFGVGQRRSGKTTLLARLAEQIGYHYIPMILPDSEGDLFSLYDVLPRGYIAAAPGSNHDPDQVRLWEVTPEDADILGYNILEEGLQVILDFASFRDSNDAWAVMTRIIDGLFAFAHQHASLHCPVEVFLDEAQKYLPQNIATSHVRDEDTRDALLQAYTDVITDGGKWGITPVIFSQRFAETNNQIMAQAEVRIILRQTHDTDLDRCKKYVNKSIATPQEIASFEKGEGVFIGDDGSQVRTQFYPRDSDGSRSHTPQAEVAQRFIDRPLENIQRHLPTTPRPATLEGNALNDPVRTDNDQQGQPRAPRQRRDSPVERGARAYLELKANGQRINQPSVAATSHIKLWEIRQIWHQILAEVERMEAEEEAEGQADEEC